MKIDLFQNATDAETFPAGTVIFREGDPGDVMYAVVGGEVVLTIGDREVERLGPGTVFGEMALVDARARSATAMTAGEARLVRVDARRFRFLVSQTPMFATQVMAIMADRLRKMNARMHNAT